MAQPSPQVLPRGRKIRVLVVDDSIVIRRLICHALEQDPAIEVVGVAANGSIALNRIPQLKPDVLTLDIEMPEMDGLALLRELRPKYPELRVVMFSTLTERGASATLESLALGADDYVTKASNSGALDKSLDNLTGELLPKIHQFFVTSAARQPAPPRAVPAQTSRRASVIVIGISTGGPSALARVMPHFPVDLPVPILIVQHMPPLFTRLLSERLSASTRLTVKEAADGDRVRPGHVYIAPGDFHMRVARSSAGVRIGLDQAPPLNSCRPSVDALFSSVAAVYGGSVAAAVMTGMGQDGLRGAAELKARGAHIVVQDQASSVVWGMPGAVATAGLADEIIPLSEMAPALTRCVQQETERGAS